MATASAPLPRPLLAGIFFLSMAMLLQEIVLTRIFSVMMFYHFAFMVVSVTLFGIGVSGVYVYLRPGAFPRERAPAQMARAVTLFAIAAPVCFLLQRALPSAPDSPRFGLLYLMITYVIIAIPFFLGGTAVSLALTHYSSGVATLYFADLVGASIGCALVFPGLTFLRGPYLIAVVGILGAFSALAFAMLSRRRGPMRMAFGALFLVSALLVVNVTGVARILAVDVAVPRNPQTHQPLRQIDLAWNPMSQVVAYEGSTRPSYLPGRPDSLFYPPQVLLQIDKSAMAWAVGFDGDFDKVGWIFSDGATLPLELKPGAKVLDIGSGGGQYALAAIGSGSHDVTCVEINPTIVKWIRTRFDDFTGHIYNRPEVRVYQGDGRTFTARSKEKYDVIAFISATTFTATTSGAFMMAENNLFTVEAFRQYWNHLNPDGMICMTQVMTREYAGLILRATVLARRTLEDAGARPASDHVVVIMKKGGGYGVMLMKKSPFTTAELDRVDSLAVLRGWEVLETPRISRHAQFHDLLTRPDLDHFLTGIHLNLFPPTDDQPFFFNLVPLRRLHSTPTGTYDIKYGKLPAQILLNLFVIVIVLTLLFLIGPLFIARRTRLTHHPGTWTTLGYFGMIGLGFILIEVPLLQRFVLFLGHPVYAITVILFSLLLFGGVGSLLTRNVTPDGAGRWLKRSLPALLLLLLLYNLALHPIFNAAQSSPVPFKIAITVLLFVPLGILMGMPFPVMMRRVSVSSPRMIPWCWGVNGATSVLGSVSSVIVALTFGFSASLLAGGLAYAVAAVCVWLLPAFRPPETPDREWCEG